ncbi:hypothetical protein [Dongia sp.]|uniref:hypothetical protein n=1 Tax=Dongia sp. TaxID=1977262 RepID=UPI0035AF224E
MMTLVGANHVTQLEQTAGMLAHILPSSLDEVTAGDVILVHGNLETKDRSARSIDEYKFGKALKIERSHEVYTGAGRGKDWRDTGNGTWLATGATMGPWTVSGEILEFLEDGDRPAQPLAEFGPPPEDSATDIKVNGTTIEYTSNGREYRISYRLWESNRPYSIAAKVTEGGLLIPIEVGGIDGPSFAVIAPGNLSDNPLSRPKMIGHKLLVLGGLCLTAALFWWLMIKWVDTTIFGWSMLTGIAVGPLAIAIQPPLIYHAAGWVIGCSGLLALIGYWLLHVIWHLFNWLLGRA